MCQDWILQTKETRRAFSNATWVPLRASCNDKQGEMKNVGYTCKCFACGSVAFPPDHRELAEKLSWSDIGIGCSVKPYAYEDGCYSSIEQYQYNDKEPIGIHLVFEHFQPVIKKRLWILNPDLVVALRLIKEGTNWVRPEENFAVVAREVFDEKGNHQLIEIKQEFLLDYLAARNLALRLSYYRQRVENVTSLEDSAYAALTSHEESRDNGRFKLLIRNLEQVYGGSWASIRVWRTDVDSDEDAPVMGPESDGNTDHERSRGYRGGYKSVRVEGEFWRDEWIEHKGQSIRVRGDADKNLPMFIVETDGTRMVSSDLNNEDIGRWLWFHPSVINELLNFRGFSLEWYTAETGGIRSTSEYVTHFGINSSDLITVYAYDVARLYGWEQHIWAAHNVVPDGKVSAELLAAQLRGQPASTHAVEYFLFEAMKELESGFRENYKIALFSHDINREMIHRISRFDSKDFPSLLRLAKEVIRIFSDQLNVCDLRKIATPVDKDERGSNMLLQDILAQKIGVEKARSVFDPIVGVYRMRIGDAHPTSSKIGEALNLAEINESQSFLRQGEQLISNFGRSLWKIRKLLFDEISNNAK